MYKGLVHLKINIEFYFRIFIISALFLGDLMFKFQPNFLIDVRVCTRSLHLDAAVVLFIRRTLTSSYFHAHYSVSLKCYTVSLTEGVVK
jgi:hypothetical protein